MKKEIKMDKVTEIFNAVLNIKQVISITNGVINYSDGTSEKACPYARYKDALKKNFNGRLDSLSIYKDDKLLTTVKSVYRIHKYYLYKGNRIVVKLKDGTSTPVHLPRF
jgi:hypothetical protein